MRPVNPRLAQLQPYPFERLRALFATVQAPARTPIRLSIGEPQHPTPQLLLDDATLPMRAGDLLVAPDGVPHGVENNSTGRLLVMALLAPGPTERPRT